MIAIKHFNMPKDCDSCPFYTYYNDAEDDCRITGEGKACIMLSTAKNIRNARLWK